MMTMGLMRKTITLYYIIILYIYICDNHHCYFYLLLLLCLFRNKNLHRQHTWTMLGCHYLGSVTRTVLDWDGFDRSIIIIVLKRNKGLCDVKKNKINM